MNIYPQILLLTIFILNIGIRLSINYKKNVNAIIITCIYIIILYLGDFWQPLINYLKG